MTQAPPAIFKVPTVSPQLVPDRIAKPQVVVPAVRAKKASGTRRNSVFARGSGPWASQEG